MKNGTQAKIGDGILFLGRGHLRNRQDAAQRIEGQLPQPEEIAALLEGIEE